jgi:hypothetical protein
LGAGKATLGHLAELICPAGRIRSLGLLQHGSYALSLANLRVRKLKFVERNQAQ